MRDDRDTFIILAALMPIGAAIGFFAWWQSTDGNPRLPGLPDISLPSLPEVHVHVPGFLMTANSYVQDHWTVMIPALIVGIVAGIWVTGTIVDVLRPVRRAVVARRVQRKQLELDEDELLA